MIPLREWLRLVTLWNERYSLPKVSLTVPSSSIPDDPRPLRQRLNVKIYFDVHDLWVGLYWTRTPNLYFRWQWTFYLCALPLLVLRVQYASKHRIREQV